MALELRPHQIHIVNQINAALRQNQRICNVSPTGTGKGVLIAYYAKRISELGKKLLVVTNRRVLVEQIGNQCQKYNIPFGIVMGNEPRNSSALVQVASMQTLKVRKWKDMPEAHWIIIDEAHQVPNSTGKLFEMHPGAKCLGMTATPVGPNGRSLVGLYQNIIEPIKNDWLIANKWLLPTKCFAPSEPDIQGVWIDKEGKKRRGVEKSNTGEFNQKQLSHVVESCTVFADIFSHWLPYSDLQTLVFVPRVKYAYGLCEQFKQRGFEAHVIEGGTNRAERTETFADYSDMKKRVLISVSVLSEGFDAPIAQVGIDLQPSFQFRNWWQRVGRIRRPYGTQKEAIWFDFAGNLWRHSIHPDQNPPWEDIVGDKTVQDVLQEKAGKKCKECGSTNIVKGRCQDCGAEVTQVKPPWKCPYCDYQLSQWERLIDGACPNCGKKGGKQVRKIRMASGKMRIVDASEIKHRKKSKATDDQKAWDKARYQAHHSGRTLSFARWLFQKATGKWPDSSYLKKCPDKNSGDWARKPSAVFEYMSRGEKHETETVDNSSNQEKPF